MRCAPQTLERIALWGVAFLVVSVPLVPFHYLLLPAGVRHLPTAVCLLLGGVCLWRRCAGFGPRLAGLPLGWPVAALLLASLLSAVGASQPVVSVAKAVYYFATGGLLFLVLVDVVRQEDQGQILLFCLLGAGYAVALCGIAEFAGGRSLLYDAAFDPGNEAYRRLVPDPWFERRIVSTVGHPVVLGSYLALLLPVSLAAAAGARARSVQAVLLCGTLALAGALLLTFSRGAWIAAAVGVGVFVLLRGGRHMLLLPAAGIVLVAGVLSASVVSDVAAARAKDAYHNYVLNFGSTTRGAAYGYAAVIANRQPLTGLGTGMYRFAAYDLRRELDIPTPLGVLDTPDNMYLVWLAENGGIGLVVAVYVLVALVQVLWRWGRQETAGSRRVLAWGFVAAFVGLAVDLLTVDALYFPVVRIAFWAMAGVAVVVVRPAAERSDG